MKELKYIVDLHGLKIIEFNEVIRDSIPYIKSKLGSIYKIDIVLDKSQAILIATHKTKIKTDGAREYHPFNKFEYKLLEKPLRDEEFNLKEDIINELGKWISYRLMDVGAIYE